MLATLANDVTPDEPGPALAHPTPLSPDWFDTGVRDINGWSNRPVAPWRRYFARYLDTMIHGLIGFMMLGYVGGMIAPNEVDQAVALFETRGGQLLEVMVTVFMAALVGAVVVGTTGSSIGKAIFGVRIVDGNLRPIGPWRGLKREPHVWLAGLGGGIALISFITTLVAYRRLLLRNVTVWDKGRYIVLHRPATNRQMALNIIGVALGLLLLGYFQALE